MQTVRTMNGALPADTAVSLRPTTANAERAQKWADELARAAAAATTPWTDETTSMFVETAGTAGISGKRRCPARRDGARVLALEPIVNGFEGSDDVKEAAG